MDFTERLKETIEAIKGDLARKILGNMLLDLEDGEPEESIKEQIKNQITKYPRRDYPTVAARTEALRDLELLEELLKSLG